MAYRIGTYRYGALIVLGLMALPLPLPLAAQHAAAKDSIPTSWDLADLYATPESWSESFARTRAAADKLDSYRTTLGASASALFSALAAISAINKESDRLGVYANLKADEDLRAANEQERRQQAQALSTLIGEKTAWVTPEIVEIGTSKVDAFERERKDLKDRFSFYLGDTLRSAPHTLGVEAEGGAGGDRQGIGAAQRNSRSVGGRRLPLP